MWTRFPAVRDPKVVSSCGLPAQRATNASACVCPDRPEKSARASKASFQNFNAPCNHCQSTRRRRARPPYHSIVIAGSTVRGPYGTSRCSISRVKVEEHRRTCIQSYCIVCLPFRATLSEAGVHCWTSKVPVPDLTWYGCPCRQGVYAFYRVLYIKKQ